MPGASGRLVPNTAAKIIDPETLQVLPPGAEGELCVKGPQVACAGLPLPGLPHYPSKPAPPMPTPMSPRLRPPCILIACQVMLGYKGRPEATAETLSSDGWLRTGDLARVDEDGNVFILDRLKELIKCKGFQVQSYCSPRPHFGYRSPRPHFG